MADSNPERPDEYDVLFDLCSHFERRVALTALLGRTEPIAVPELANAIAENAELIRADRANQRSETRSGVDAPERLRVTLHHMHLPRLADAGLVEYNAERRRVEPTAELEQLRSHLGTMVDVDPALPNQSGN